MPRILLTEEEAELIRKQREIKALQAVAWNEAIDECVQMLFNHVTINSNSDTQELAKNVSEQMQLMKRKP